MKISLEDSVQDLLDRFSAEAAVPKQSLCKAIGTKCQKEISTQALCKRSPISLFKLCVQALFTGSIGKILIRGLLARSLHKISIGGFLARSLYEISLGGLCTRSP